MGNFCINIYLFFFNQTISPKAALGISRALTDDGSIPGANIRMEAAKQILDRVGLVKKEKIDINAKVAHGIFVLPAKEA
jgi:hypothetical protein